MPDLTPPTPPRSALLRSPSLVAVGCLVLLVGVLASWAASRRQGQDYFPIYVSASGALARSPIYDRVWHEQAFATLCGEPPSRPGLLYPPSTAVSALPLTLLSCHPGQRVWFVLLVGSVIFGIRALVRLVRPDAPPALWMLAAGAALLSACVRWGMTPLQGAPLMLGLFCFLIVALHTNRRWLAFGIAAGALAFKFTLALPFVALVLLHRRYGAVAAILAIWVALNGIGFAVLGGQAAFAGYRANISELEAPTELDTPDPWSLRSIPRLDWNYLLHGLGLDLPRARLVTLGLAALAGLWLLIEMWRVRGPVTLPMTTAFALPLGCLGLLAVYHHHYDLSPLIAPLLAWSLAPSPRRRAIATVLGVAPLVVVMTVAPIAQLHRLVVSLGVPQVWGVVNLMFPTVVTLAFAATMVRLHREISLEQARAY